jgi:hypothetical protein
MSNHMTHIIPTKLVKDFIQASTVHSEILYNTVVATVHLDVTALPPNRNLDLRF